MKIAVVIPAYNEALNIGKVLSQLPKTILGHEVFHVVADDGSTDDTNRVAKDVASAHVVRHRINLGKGAAAKTGCDAAYRLGADIIVLMDGDGQHRPFDVKRIVEPLLNKSTLCMIVGSRKVGRGMPLLMRVGNIGLSTLARTIFNINVSDTQSGFRAFTRETYPKIRWKAADYAMETEMLILGAVHGVEFIEVEIETVYLNHYKGTTILDGLRIAKTLLIWRLLWFRAYRSLESFSV